MKVYFKRESVVILPEDSDEERRLVEWAQYRKLAIAHCGDGKRGLHLYTEKDALQSVRFLFKGAYAQHVCRRIRRRFK